MKFSANERIPLFEVCAGVSKYLVDVQAGKEIVITRQAKPEGALPSAARVLLDLEHELILGDLLPLLQSAAPQLKLNKVQIAVVREAENLLVKPMERA